VAVEACASAHHWARAIGALEHEIKLIAPGYVKPFVKLQKNDTADAEAIAEAASRPTMRFVAPKTEAQRGTALWPLRAGPYRALDGDCPGRRWRASWTGRKAGQHFDQPDHGAERTDRDAGKRRSGHALSETRQRRA
jgi:transposase